MDRRSFLSVSGLGAAAITMGATPRRAMARSTAPRKAKNMVFMVADGMSFGTLLLGDMLRRKRDGRTSHWLELMQREGVSRALVETHSADSLVTDSAAASTAWSIGERVNNGRIGLTPDGRMPTPILMHAKQGGRAIGVVTTARVTHATPAGFCCNVPTTRDEESGIAEQMLTRGIDLMLGGGGKFMSPDLVNMAGYKGTVVRTAAEFGTIDPATHSGQLLGVFNGSHMSYEVDRVRALDSKGKPMEPSLAEMARFALRSLERAPNGFALQIEGGRVDHGGHTNDAAALIYDQVAFDDALSVVWEWIKDRDDTLLIVTADHATANPGLTEYNQRATRGFDTVLGFNHSYAWIDKMLGDANHLEAPEPPEDDSVMVEARALEISGERVRDVIHQATGIELTAREVDVLQRWKRGELVDPYRTNNARYAPLAAVLANHTAIAFLSPNHTSDPVELTSFGPGSELLPDVMGLPDVHAVMTKALDLPPAKPV